MGTQLPTHFFGPGSVVQTVHQAFSDVSTSSSPNLPFDDTIPQNTEGFQLMSLAITPKFSSSYLLVTAVVFAAHSTSNSAIVVAMFRDSGADAIVAGAFNVPGANYPSMPVLSTRVMAGSTASTTFYVRGGTNDGNTFTFNGTAGVRKFGGKVGSSITITEIAA